MKTLKESLFSKKNLESLKNLKSLNKSYNVSEKDMILDINGFPVGVVVRMMEEQETQGNKPDVTVFQKNKTSGKRANNGGFDWDETIDGQGFWYKVISFKDFNLFFERYPEYENI